MIRRKERETQKNERRTAVPAKAVDAGEKKWYTTLSRFFDVKSGA